MFSISPPSLDSLGVTKLDVEEAFPEEEANRWFL
jgi:hypothetical protein